MIVGGANIVVHKAKADNIIQTRSTTRTAHIEHLQQNAAHFSNAE